MMPWQQHRIPNISGTMRKRRAIQWEGAADSAAFERRTTQPPEGTRAGSHPLAGGRRREGIALVIAITAVAMMAIFLTDMHENTSTSFAAVMEQRDRVKAEYLAVSAINLTRLLIAHEPMIRQMVSPLYQALIGSAPTQIPVWMFANEILKPFCDYSQAQSVAKGSLGFRSVKGLGDIDGVCTIRAVSENGKINVNNPLLLDPDAARQSIATQLMMLMQGGKIPSPYDPMFQGKDADGLTTSRQDIIGSLVDWWDYDQERTALDPATNTVRSGGAEDNMYTRLADPYAIKNAPLDSLEELRLIRGVGEQFWAAFVQPDPDAQDQELLTVYGTGAINPNEASPEVILARVCSITGRAVSLCSDPVENTKFVQLLKTVRAMFPIPWFRSGQDVTALLEGKGGPKDLYTVLVQFLGKQSPLLFRPIGLTETARTQLAKVFVTEAQILSIRGSATVGHAQVSIRSIVNFHSRWSPPPPNAGAMTPLGVFHYWRVD
jgi:general secretion pathway protein K